MEKKTPVSPLVMNDYTNAPPGGAILEYATALEPGGFLHLYPDLTSARVALMNLARENGVLPRADGLYVNILPKAEAWIIRRAIPGHYAELCLKCGQPVRRGQDYVAGPIEASATTEERKSASVIMVPNADYTEGGIGYRAHLDCRLLEVLSRILKGETLECRWDIYDALRGVEVNLRGDIGLRQWRSGVFYVPDVGEVVIYRHQSPRADHAQQVVVGLPFGPVHQRLEGVEVPAPSPLHQMGIVHFLSRARV